MSLKCQNTEVFVVLEIQWSVFQKSYIRLPWNFCGITITTSVEYFVLWAGFNFELCEDTKWNTGNWPIIDVGKLLSGR